MNGGARGRSEEMKEEETGRPAGTVTALTSSDLVPSLNLGRVGTNLNVTMGSEAPELSVLLPHAGIYVRPATPDLLREEKPRLLFAGCVIDLRRDVQQS